jgi:outer membrane protein assembly factor BamB
MTAINAKTGAQVWRTGNYMVRESIGLAEDQTRFFVRAMQDFMYAFSTTSSQPETIWEAKPGFSYDINSAMPVEKDGALFYGTKNGLLFALDSKTGVTRWQHRIGVGVINTVVPLGGDQVLAADFDGNVTMIGKATQ